MLKELATLVDVLNTKIKPLVEAIEKEDPTSEKFGTLLSNFNIAMIVQSNVNSSVMSAVAQIEEAKNNKEEKEDGTNN